MRNGNENSNGRTALVTGASGGIGGAISVQLAKVGYGIALNYNHHFPEETMANIENAGGHCKAFKADFSIPGFETELLDAIRTKFGHPDVLVNCAASQDLSPLSSMSLSEFDTMLNINVGAVFALSQAFAQGLHADQAPCASIINISSIEASRPAPDHAHYATSKAALEMLTKSMALEYGKTGLRVNAVAPGLIRREGIETDWPEGVARWQGSCPLKRMGEPIDVANAVAFLASDAASFVNGSVLVIDGGMGATQGW